MNSNQTSEKQEEMILVTPTKIINEIGAFQGFTDDVEPYLQEIFDKEQTTFIARNNAEKDPNFKQIIPYCIIIQSGKVLVYQRGQTGGEQRLKNLWSCGIGGHINPIDSEDSQNTKAFSRFSLRNALLRELKEELNLPEGEIKFRTAGLINDDSNAVGQVHLGLIEVAELTPTNSKNSKNSKNSETIQDNIPSPAEDAIAKVKLVSFEEFSSMEESLENWSQIVAKNIKTIFNGDKDIKYPLTEFHLDIGDEKGILGIGAVVKAATKKDAINIIENFLPEEISLTELFDRKKLKESSVEYINLYLRKENLIKEQIEFKENE